MTPFAPKQMSLYIVSSLVRASCWSYSCLGYPKGLLNKRRITKDFFNSYNIYCLIIIVDEKGSTPTILVMNSHFGTCESQFFLNIWNKSARGNPCSNQDSFTINFF